MTFQIQEIFSDHLFFKFRVTIFPDQIAGKMNEWFEKYQSVVQADGFRTGQVPRTVVESRFQSKALKESTETLIQEAIQQIKRDHFSGRIFKGDVRANYSSPKVGHPGVGEIFVALEADFDWKAIKPTLQFRRIDYQMSDEELLPELNQFIASLQYHAKTPKSSGEVEWGDYILLDLEVSNTKGRKLKGDWKDSQFFVHKTRPQDPLMGQLVPHELVESLIGRRKDDTVLIHSTIQDPLDQIYKNRGQTLSFRATIRNIYPGLIFSELNDEYLRYIEKSREDYLNQMRPIFSMKIKEKVNLYHKSCIFDELVKKISFESPQSFVEKEFQVVKARLEQEANRLREKSDASSEDIMTPEEIEETARQLAERRVKLSFILDRITHDEEMSISHHDVEKQLKKNLYTNPHFRVLYQNNPNVAFESVLTELKEDRVIQSIWNASTQPVEILTRKEIHDLMQGILPDFDEEMSHESSLAEDLATEVLLDSVEGDSVIPNHQ
jgi:trigger factor